MQHRPLLQAQRADLSTTQQAALAASHSIKPAVLSSLMTYVAACYILGADSHKRLLLRSDVGEAEGKAADHDLALVLHVMMSQLNDH